MTALRQIFDEIMRPSAPDEPPYLTLLIAIGHALLGAAAASLGVPFLAGMALYWLKEWRDMRRGGSLRDSAMDAAFVALGWLYPVTTLWPALVLILALLAAILPGDTDAR